MLTVAVLLLNIFSIVTQWGFCEYVLSKKINSDIFNKSAFTNGKLIVCSPKMCDVYFKLGGQALKITLSAIILFLLLPSRNA